MAHQTILECKQKVDRLCMLSLEKDEELATVFNDHRRIANALQNKSTEKALSATRQHLSRLDDTIASIHSTHAEYFE